jgi:hypothetical protein
MNSENNNNGFVKQAYHHPEFHIYGNISNLTTSITNGMGSSDNADPQSVNKTKPNR